MIYTRELKELSKGFRSYLYLNVSELSSFVGEHTELACIVRANTDNPNLMSKRNESQKDDPTHHLMQKIFNSLYLALLGKYQPSAQEIQMHLITLSRPAPVQEVTDLSIN